ncbi:MAG: DUF1749 domain-containing protein [Candidatus Aenigmarchaeota archaeon]|nr:DUF1749 domain-containing protein [Candidatus Aenigmarchaeota archaeon]
MDRIKCVLVRIETKDNLELVGLLYEPKIKTDKILIHSHAWIGNFYENIFIDYIAKEAIAKGFAFLTYNNRGAGIITDFIKKEKEKRAYFRFGGSIEIFEDCIIDISAGIDFVFKRGYKQIILEGHSLGCQKIAFYESKTNDERVKAIVLLSPIDDIAYVKRLLGDKYDSLLKTAREMKQKGKGNNLIPENMAFYPLMSVNRYLDLMDPTTTHGNILNYSDDLKEVKKIAKPMLAIFGSNDDYENQPQKTLALIEKKLRWDICLLQDADHWFFGQEEKLSNKIFSWIEKQKI